jgi:hypothetical protein
LFLHRSFNLTHVRIYGHWLITDVLHVAANLAWDFL